MSKTLGGLADTASNLPTAGWLGHQHAAAMLFPPAAVGGWQFVSAQPGRTVPSSAEWLSFGQQGQLPAMRMMPQGFETSMYGLGSGGVSVKPISYAPFSKYPQQTPAPNRGLLFTGVNSMVPARKTMFDYKEGTKRARLDVVSGSSDTESDTDSETQARFQTNDSEDGVRVKGPWTSQEDKRLKELVAEFGPRWSVVAERLPGRIGKQCRERWLNHLDDRIKRVPWTPAEDAILIEAHKSKGNRWCQIAKLLPGRPENSVKNRYTSLAHKQAKGKSSTSSSPLSESPECPTESINITEASSLPAEEVKKD